MLDFRYDEIMNEAHLQIHSINNTQNSSSNLLDVKEPAINSVCVLVDLQKVPSLCRNKSGDPCEQTNAIGTVKRDDQRVQFILGIHFEGESSSTAATEK